MKANYKISAGKTVAVVCIPELKEPGTSRKACRFILSMKMKISYHQQTEGDGHHPSAEHTAVR